MHVPLLLLLASATLVVAAGPDYFPADFTPKELDLVKTKLKEGDGITLLHKLGTGAMGSVFAATHENGTNLAVKLSRSNISNDENWESAAATELLCLEKTSHPKVIEHLGDSYFIFPDYDVLAIFTELLGPNLRTLIHLDDTANGLPVSVVYRLACQVSEGLAYMHSNLIAHHDIKPMNLVLDGQLDDSQDLKLQLLNANFKIIDVSLCEVYETQDDLEPIPSGTPLYYSPEKANVGHPYNPFLADAYALGYTLVESLLGPRLHVALMMKIHKETGLAYSQITITEIYRKYRSAMPRNLKEQPFFELIANLIETDPAKRMSIIEFHRRLTQDGQSTRWTLEWKWLLTLILIIVVLNYYFMIFYILN